MTVDVFWFSVLVLLNAIILFLLTANVSRLRLKLNVSVGDGDHPALIRAIRAHGNGVEQFPVYALIILALSWAQLPSVILAALVMLFCLARVLHGVGMLSESMPSRRIGAALTYALQLAGIAALAWQVLF